MTKTPRTNTNKKRKLHTPPDLTVKRTKPKMPAKAQEAVVPLAWKKVDRKIAKSAIFKEALKWVSCIPPPKIVDTYSNQNSVDEIEMAIENSLPIPPPTPKARANVAKHLTELPSLGILMTDDVHNACYAVTTADGHTCLSAPFFAKISELEEDTIEFVHASFFLAITLLHEASHAKIRYHHKSCTPTKGLITKYQVGDQSESGEYVENELVGYKLDLSFSYHVLIQIPGNRPQRLKNSYFGLSEHVKKVANLPLNRNIRKIQDTHMKKIARKSSLDVPMEFKCMTSKRTLAQVDKMIRESVKVAEKRGYGKGYGKGFEEGREEGLEEARDESFEEGRDEGLEEGYNKMMALLAKGYSIEDLQRMKSNGELWT